MVTATGCGTLNDTVNCWAPRWVLWLSSGHSDDTGALWSVANLSAGRQSRDAEAASLADEELALRFRRGDHHAFDLLYARYRAPLLRFVTRTMPDPSDAEEVVQEIWLAVIRGQELAC